MNLKCLGILSTLAGGKVGLPEASLWCSEIPGPSPFSEKGSSLVLAMFPFVDEAVGALLK